MADSQWVEYENYYLHRALQGTPGWLQSREGKITGSRLAGVLGKSRFCAPKTASKKIKGTHVDKFTPINLANMKRGNDLEPFVRKWYEDTYNVKVIEVGFAVSKKDPKVGNSPDGLIGEDGMLEIKCPVKMYGGLLEHEYMKQYTTFDKYYHGHILDEHYYQCQNGLFVFQREWQDYLVYTKDKQIVNRIYFNKEEWDNETKPAMDKYCDQYGIKIFKICLYRFFRNLFLYCI